MAARDKTSDEIDKDIIEEEDRVSNLPVEGYPVRVYNVMKTFDTGVTKAIKNISFGLDYGECFALLGVSGAGKSTLFKCMTGEIFPSAGELSLCGFDVTDPSGFKQARKHLGYCPQFDCIFEGLTVMEHMVVYSSIKGIKK